METRSPNPQLKINFDDVIIRFTQQIYYDNEQAFQLEVRQSPGPLPGGAFQADVESRLEEFRRIFGQRVTINQFSYHSEKLLAEAGSAQDLAYLGNRLYELLPESFRQAFPHLVQDVFEKGRGLRLVIEARAGDKADRLLSLPWEILFFNQTQAFLARSPRVLVVRRLLDAVRRSPIQIETPFNIVHVIAHDSGNPEEYGISAELQQAEREGIGRAIVPGQYRLVEKPGSVEQLLAALREGAYHVVHFLGHGEIHELEAAGSTRVDIKCGYLRFVGANGDAQWVTGEQLQHLLGFTPTVQLAVLNACHGGASASGSVGGNIALELTYSGLPNVVAMQSDISQGAAQHFVEAFYAELQRGQPVDYAVAVGRAIIAANLPQTIDWCLPVLYTNIGLPEPLPLVGIANRLWQWVSSPQARWRLGVANGVLGILHLIVGLLLSLSNKRLALPDAHLANWLTAGLVVAPALLTVSAYLLKRLAIPAMWPRSAKTALIACSFGAAALGLSMPILYVWFALMLLVGVGFWEILSPVAQAVLLGLIFIPGVLCSGVFSYSQIVGHSRAFITNAQVKLPTFEWGELAVIIASYLMLLLPWAILTFWPGFITPPVGNLILGMLLSILGYELCKT